MVKTGHHEIVGHSHVRDKVSQVYLGTIDWGPTGEILRRRIDWMVDQAQGPRVLDVGCSEGILEVLLARRGIEVTGVEVNPDALEFARDLLAKEPEGLRAHARLIEGDFIGERPVTGLFDTVVLGEILEHLHDPGPLLNRSLEHLRPGGRLVITTPFGLHPHEDHHQTFYLTNVIDALKSRVGLEHMSVEDSYIRFVGLLTKNPEPSWQRLDAEAVLSMTETAIIASQTKLEGMLSRRESRTKELERQRNRLRDRVASDQMEIQDLKRQVRFDKMALERFKRNLDTRTGEVRVLRHRLQAAYSSTSFLAGAALVRAARKPHTLWKLPFQMLRLYGSASKRTAEISPAEDLAERYKYIPKSLNLDISEFLSYPPMAIPEAKTEGPPVAAILDTFTEHSLRYEANLLLLSRENWRDQLGKTKPAFLFVESAFSGNNRDWRHKIVGYENLEDNPLRELIEYCRSSGIPTVFWNKEDPPHFDDFIGAAREFDYVFTSDEHCVPIYRETLGHDRIYVLPFAAQPRLHNPSQEEGWPNYPVSFPGSWLQHRYPERAESLQNLLDPAMPLGLHIFDRNLTRRDLGPYYRFPEQYKEAIKGYLTYEEMLTAYRCYDVLLNVNTVSDSPTMFSRRVFESLACGTPVISSESDGMSRMLGEHVRVSRSKEDTIDHLLELMGDEEARVREGHLAYRYVHENHTYRHRMNEVFRRIGLQSLVSESPSVSVLMPTMRPENVLRCLENFRKQTYPNKELILILNNAEFDLGAIRKHTDGMPNVQILHMGGPTSLGDCLNRGISASTGDYVAKMDDDDHYGEHYLSDSVLAASFSEAEVTGKGSFFMYFEDADTTALAEVAREHTFTHFVTGGTMFIRSDVARKFPFDAISLREDTNFLHAVAQAGCRIYAADRFNFIRVRSDQLSNHADPTPNVEFLRRCRAKTSGLDLSRAMI